MSPWGSEPQTSDEAGLVVRLFGSLPAMVAFGDREGRNVLANEAYAGWFGLTPEQVRGQHLSELLGATLYEQNRVHIERVLAGEPQLFERVLVGPDGHTRHVQASYLPMRRDGEVDGFLVHVTDVSAIAEARRELALAEHLARMGSWVYRPLTGEITYSEELHRITGLPRDPAPTFETSLAVVHPEDQSRVAEVIAGAVATGEDRETEYRIVRPDGDLRFVHGVVAAQQDATGTVVLLRGTVQDVTAEHAAQVALEQANAQLVEKNQLLGDMVGMLGHDLRNPASAVAGFLGLALDRWDELTPDRQRGFVERAAGSARRVNDLLTDVLAMARSDAGTLEADPSPVAVAELVRVLLRDSVFGVQVEVDVLDDVTIEADPSQLRQVLGNLVTNAARYGEPPVRIAARGVGRRVEITVADHGEGVPEEFVPHLFERFSRAESGKAVTRSGTGLGLHIVDMLCRANRGSVRYREADGGGAEFVVDLPSARS